MQKQDLSVFDSIPPSQSSSTSQLQGTCGNDAEAGSGTSWPQVTNNKMSMSRSKIKNVNTFKIKKTKSVILIVGWSLIASFTKDVLKRRLKIITSAPSPDLSHRMSLKTAITFLISWANIICDLMQCNIMLCNTF